MNNVELGIFKGFIPPTCDGLCFTQFVSRLVNNILTLGIHVTTENIGYQSRVYELEREQALLLRKYAHLKENWKIIEQRLSKLIDEVLVWQEQTDVQDDEMEELQSKVQQLLLEKDERDQQKVILKEESYFQRLNRKALSTFSALGQLSFDLFYLGFQGCYQNYLCAKRIKILQAQNDYLENQVSSFQEEYDSFFQKNIDLLNTGIECKSDLVGIQHTDPAKAYFQVSDLNRKMQALQQQRQDLQKQFDHLQVQYKTSKEAENSLAILKQSFDDLSKEKQGLQHQIIQLQGENQELMTLRQQMQNMKQTGQGLDSELEGLQKRIGPLLPKYTPEKKELENLEQAKETEDKKFSDSYAQRYAGIKMAPEAFAKGFAYSLKEVFDMAEKGKIKLNRSLGTPTSKGGQVAYRFLALDWIKGGKLVATCHGYHELHLNDKGLELVPSLPENVLKYKETDGKYQPLIMLHFQARDDFIPGEDELKHTSAACGIDPVAAKCLWVSLISDEKEHFFNLLLDPAVEDDDPNYLAALNFIGKQPKKKQQAMYILRDLISDMATALETKFKQDIAMQEWQNYIDVDDLELQPFTKKEKEEVAPPSNVAKDEFDDGPLFPWQINCEILSGTMKGITQQEDFLELILNAQEKYQTYFKNLKPELIENPMIKGKVINSITWSHLKKQYYTTHKLIGYQGCLLSNLLAVLMVDPKDLTSENIQKLKIAMATYLDDPQHAEMFEGALKNDFGSKAQKSKGFTMQQFKDWLRGKNNFLNGVELTPVILEIAAYTLGVRIVLFSPPSDSGDWACTKGKVDQYGRLVPVEDISGHHFGPPTEEMFFMAVEDDYSYFGLFPKLKLGGVNQKKLGINNSDWVSMNELNNYWKSIHIDYL